MEITSIFDSKTNSPSVKQDSNTVLIIGNGFDLDLGMKTRYIDFASDKEFWPFGDKHDYEENTLPCYLNKIKDDVKTWFDLELLLASYASIDNSTQTNFNANKDREYLTELTDALARYLYHQEELYLEKMSQYHCTMRATISKQVIDSIVRKTNYSIYSFNYTNLLKIFNSFSLGSVKCQYIHGSLNDNNIILGTGDLQKLKDDYFFFHKSANRLYKSCNLVEDLQNADEIYIFGHSLGDNDHDYFLEFFDLAIRVRQGSQAKEKIKLRFFTYDNNSETELKQQLMKLTHRHLSGLYAHCDLKFFKTKNREENLWELKDMFR